MGIRIAIVDDNPHVTWNGRVHPVNATFQHFASGLLDLPGAPVATITSCVPLRAADAAPGTRPLDPRIVVAGTTPFDGIAGYVRHAPALLRANRPILGHAIREADLVWIKVPASNGALAAAIARVARVPRFGYVAGSAADVAAARYGGLGARVVGMGYDAVGRLASIGGDRVIVGRDLDGRGIVTSLVEPGEVLDRRDDPWPGTPGRLELAWAGRVVDGKGLDELLTAIAQLAGRGATGGGALDVRLTMIGSGPAEERLASLAATLGISDRVTWTGYIADRATYMAALAEVDAFVFPSPAEGFPKVVLDAMAVGLPVVARPSGALARIGADRIGAIATDDPEAIVDAIHGLVERPARVLGLRVAGGTFAAAHTRLAEADRLVGRWRARWPNLPWDG